MKMKKYLLIFAAFVAASVSFTACSSEEDLAGQDAQGTVKTEFTISFPTKMASSTRQSIIVVQGQATPVFRGISGITLRPFLAAKENITANTTLPGALSFTGIDIATGGLNATSNSHLYKDVEINIGTRAFMFYGVASLAPSGSVTSNALNGSLTQEISDTDTKLSGVSFKPTPIYDSEAVPVNGAVIANYLTAIANAKVSNTETWANSTELSTLYNEFIGMKTGSWTSVQKAVQALYTTLYTRNEAIAGKIRDAILAATYEVGGTAQALATDKAGDGGAATGVLAFVSLGNEYGQYPADLGLPDGAAYINWNTTTKKFDVLTSTESTSAIDNAGLNFTSLKRYCYPASLNYYGLSNIKTSKESKEAEYTKNQDWDAILATYPAADGSVVQSTTRSIAIIEPVQYAVGRLDVAVKTKGGAATLKDNDGTNGKDITIDNNFPITGILVGNQKAVDYKFETTNTLATSTTYTIYDSQIPQTDGTINKDCRLFPGNINAPSATSPFATNDGDYNRYCTHTLVLETADAATAEDEDIDNVTVAVEFQNNSDKIIVGKDKKLIYPGTKFYLVGTLKPKANTTIKYSADHVPTGKTTNDVIERAFVQDYVTRVTFTVESLKNAYNVVPDLRNPHLEIGLSVDLTWQYGINQDITIQ
jgi:predicted small secreted protein